MAVSNSQGTTLKFTPEDGTQVTVGKLTSVGEIQPEAEEIDITTLDSEGGYREFMQGFRDSGEVELSGYHVTFTGFIKSHTVGSAEVDGAIGFGAVVRISGPVVVTEAA